MFNIVNVVATVDVLPSITNNLSKLTSPFEIEILQKNIILKITKIMTYKNSKLVTGLKSKNH